MQYGRMVKVITPSLFGGVEEAVLYVVGAEDPGEAKKLVENEVAVGSKIEDVGRVSHQLLAALGLNPYKVTRI
jgi:hypothetical protein